MPGCEEGGAFARLPAVDRVLRRPDIEECARAHGRELVVEAVRGAIDDLRAAMRRGDRESSPDSAEDFVAETALERGLSPSWLRATTA